MKALILILTQLIGPLSGSVRAQQTSEDAAPVRCCCCLVGACNCGCKMPAAPAESGNEEEQGRSQLCMCDDTPLGLPSAPVPALERLAIVAVIPKAKAASEESAAVANRSSHWPHGPPPAIPILATIILLN